MVNIGRTPLKFVKILPVKDPQGKTLPVPASYTLTLCERISWRSGGADDSVLCSCTDGVVREYFVQELMLPLSSLSSTLEYQTYETVLPTRERIIRIPITAPNLTTTGAVIANGNASGGADGGESGVFK